MKSFILTITFISLAIYHTAFAQLPLSGNYTINSILPSSPTNFPSFNAFADSINSNGISGDVIVVVTPGSGPYTEQVVFSNITGTGPGATVTLDGSGETITALTTTTNRHIVRLSNLQYFTINNLRVVRDPAATSGFYGIHIFGTGSFITISDCEVDMTGSNSTLVGAYIASGSETSILETGDFHNISIINNSSTGGGYGASIFGLISNLSSNILISGNNFFDFHSNGVYLRETNGAIVSGNNFDKSTSNVTSCNAIQLAQAANINGQIYNNRIRVGQLANGNVTFRGIYLFNGTGHKVYNNLIHDINLTSGNVTGIEIRTAGTAPEISFNTISIDNATATTGDLFGIKEELSNTNAILRNNLISITQPTSGSKAGLVIGSIANATTAFNSNYNDIWVPGGNTALKNSLTPVMYPTLAAWQGASAQDANSIATNPLFLSVTVPQPTNLTMDNLGIQVTGITTDILGITRGPVPDIGAYEFNTTGLNDLSDKNIINIYPNPARGIIHIQLHETSGQYELKMYDATGRLVLTQSENAAHFIFDGNNFHNGIYMISISDGHRVSSSKIILQ